MEVSVRYMPTDSGVYKGSTYAIGFKPILCFRDHTKKAYGVVYNDSGIERVKLDPETIDSYPIVHHRGEAYPPQRFVDHILTPRGGLLPKPIKATAQRLLDLVGDPKATFVEDHEEAPPPPEPKTEKKEAKDMNLIQQLCDDYKTTGSKIRKFLRAQGLHAPYDDTAGIRALMRNFK